jgi:uncharacterized protein YndB with AHSA1/START domain
MTTVTIDTRVATSAEKLWDALRQPESTPPWSSPMAKVGDSEQSGTMRAPGGGTIVQRLQHFSESERLYIYSIAFSSLPVKDCVTKCRVIDNGDGTSTVEWSSSFSPDGADEDEASRLLRSLFETGVRNFKQMYPG